MDINSYTNCRTTVFFFVPIIRVFKCNNNCAYKHERELSYTANLVETKLEVL